MKRDYFLLNRATTAKNEGSDTGEDSDPRYRRVGEYEAQLDKTSSCTGVKLPRTLSEMDATFGRAPYREDLGPCALCCANCHRTEAGAGLLIHDETIQCHKSRLVGETVMCSSYTWRQHHGLSGGAQRSSTCEVPVLRPRLRATVTNVERELGKRLRLMKPVTVLKQPVAFTMDALKAFDRAPASSSSRTSPACTDESHGWLAVSPPSRIRMGCVATVVRQRRSHVRTGQQGAGGCRSQRDGRRGGSSGRHEVLGARSACRSPTHKATWTWVAAQFAVHSLHGSLAQVQAIQT
jgi:hypothetical protein